MTYPYDKAPLIAGRSRRPAHALNLARFLVVAGGMVKSAGWRGLHLDKDLIIKAGFALRGTGRDQDSSSAAL
jgi:hypothetical protein